MRILAIGAHYDDVELGCGGTLLNHIRNGDDVWLAITRSDETRTGNMTVRFREQLKAAKLLKIQPNHIMRFEEGYGFSNIVGELDRIEADIIFTHFEKDTHQHHRHASQMGQAVGRKKHMTTVFYDSGTSYDFHPNLFSFIDMKQKLNLINCFGSQLACGAINVDIAERKAAYYASLISSGEDEYAEGFVVRKMRWIV